MVMQLFVMGEVAVELFQESPTAFSQVRCSWGKPTPMRACVRAGRTCGLQPCSLADIATLMLAQ